MRGRLLLLTIIIFLFAFEAAAQTGQPNTLPPAPKPKPPPKDDILRDKDSEQEVSLPEEMRIRMAIERADNEHRKVMEDVEKLNDLSTEVASKFQERGKLSSDEFKKLGTIEKLAKRILSHAGGDEIDDRSGKITRMSVADLVNNISTAAATIRKRMTEKTRHVVSATVIANSNDIINMAQLIRRTQKPN